MIIPFGRFKGREIADVADSDDGLRYLDWLVGWIESDDDRKANMDGLLQAIREHLARPEIARRVDVAIEGSWADRPKDPEPKKWWEK